MALRINFNAAAVRSHLNLTQTDRTMAQVSEKITSGVRIRRAADDPAAMVLANNLRYHLGGMQQATDNVESGVNMLQTADAAMGEMSSILNRMRGLALQAANNGANQGEQVQALQAEMDQLIESFQRIATETQFGGVNMLDGTFADNTFERDITDSRGLSSIDYYREFTQDYSALEGGIEEGSRIEILPPSGTITRSSVAVTLTGPASPLPADTAIQDLTQNGTALDAASGSTVTVTGISGSIDIALFPTTSIADIVDQVNGTTSRTGVRAQYDADTGQLELEAVGFGGGGVRVSSTDATSGGSNIGLLDSDTTSGVNAFMINASNQTIQLRYTDAAGDPQSAILVQIPEERNGLVFESGGFRLRVRDTSGGGFGSAVSVTDISFFAQRESTRSIQSGPRTDQRQRIEIRDLRTRSIGREAGMEDRGYVYLDSIRERQSFLIDEPQEALEMIDAVIEELNTQRARSGTVQAAALETTLSYLQVNIENLTNTESILRDTDYAKQSSVMVRENIKFQAATAMLAQANQIPQTVLQLLGGN